MRRSLPIVLTLAALTTVGASGTASAISNNLNPWSTTSGTLKKPPATQTNQNPPPTQTNQNSSATQTRVTPPAHANQNPSAPQTTAPNSSTTQTNSYAGNQPNPTPAANPKKDIAQQYQDIKKYQSEIAQLQQAKQIDARKLASFGTLGRTTCDSSGNCVRSYKSQSFGNASVFVEIRVDAKGLPLPGEFDKMLNAQTTAIDKAIAYNTRLIADAKKQIDADYSVLPGQGITAGSGVNNHKGSTALHQD